jgi:hypothetical protein
LENRRNVVASNSEDVWSPFDREQFAKLLQLRIRDHVTGYAHVKPTNDNVIVFNTNDHTADRFPIHLRVTPSKLDDNLPSKKHGGISGEDSVVASRITQETPNALAPRHQTQDDSAGNKGT